MHLRRALLLFALVLGLAALAASVARQPTGDRRTANPRPTPAAPAETAPERKPQSIEVRFEQDRPKVTRRLPAGRPAVVVVAVDDPGVVEVGGLGLSAPADPLTPARFDVLPDRPGAYAIWMVPAGKLVSDRIGTLRVLPER